MASTEGVVMFKPFSKTITAMIVGMLSLLMVTGCTTDGGVSNANPANSTNGTNGMTESATPTPTTTESSTTQTSNASLPVVTGDKGKAPTIAAPTGTPPTTLVTKDIFLGSGSAATGNSTLTVQYTLMAWSTGKVVESSWTSSPATFPLSGVIVGWQQGIPGMKVGGRRLLVIPPALGYGSTGSGPIAANETLIFVVDVLAIK